MRRYWLPHGLNTGTCGPNGMGLHRWSAESYKPRCLLAALALNLKSRSACRVRSGQRRPRNMAPIDRYRPGCSNAMSRTVETAHKTAGHLRWHGQSAADARSGTYTMGALRLKTQCLRLKTHVSLQQAHPGQAGQPTRMPPLARARLSPSAAQLCRPRQAQLCYIPQAHTPAHIMPVRSSQHLLGAPWPPRVQRSALLAATYGSVQPVLGPAQARSLHRPRQRLLLRGKPARQQALPGCGGARARRGHGARARRTSAVSPVQGSRYLTSRWMTLLQKGQVGSRPCLRARRRPRLSGRPAPRHAATPSDGGSAGRAACSSRPRSGARERGRARRCASQRQARAPLCRAAGKRKRQRAASSALETAPIRGAKGRVGRAPVALRQPALDAGLVERVAARQRLARRRVARLAQPGAAARAADGRRARA
jgi:hypothetical protein